MADRITDALRGFAPAQPKLPNAQADSVSSSGYQPPTEGPFECDNCTHFDGQSRCNNPEVVSDPQVQGNVEPEGCCNLFESSHKEDQQSEHTEGLEPEPEEEQ